MNAFSLIFSDSFNDERMGELIVKRNLGSVPFGGRYRLIDFLLSSLVNAGVYNIGVITRDNYNSLMDHLGSGKDWDLDRKNGGLKLLTPYFESNNRKIRNRMDALISVRTYIKNAKEDYCILSDSNIICNVDFDSVIKTHIEKKADITCLYRTGTVRDGETSIVVTTGGKVVDALYHIDSLKEERDVILKTYVINRTLLLELIDRAITFGWDDLDRDFIAKSFKTSNIYAYKITGHCNVVRDINDYYGATMELLKKDVRDEILRSGHGVYTKTKHSVPTMYGDNCHVSNSIIADGCKIGGIVENSVLFRGTIVKEGAVIRNSIIMQNSVINENCVLTNVISDKNIEISQDKVLTGYSSLPFVIAKGTKI